MKRKYESATWMHLLDDGELEYLKHLMAEKRYDGKIIEVESIDNRSLVWIRMPGYKPNRPITALYGEDYIKWEWIKSKIYRSRRKTLGP